MNTSLRSGDEPAPIAVFVFKRPEHTARTFAALAANPGFRDSRLVVYCDAARASGDEAAVEATRRVVRDVDHPRKELRLAATNRGLAASIIGGVSELCSSHGRVIVIEDDLIVAPGFLAYMNQALARYRETPQVMQVSGYMFPVDLGAREQSLFLPFTTTWGWATWARAWQHFDPAATGASRVASRWRDRLRFDLDGHYPYLRMLQRQLAGEIDSWGIRWYLSVHLADGLTLYPRHTLVSNIGFDGSGTHCGIDDAARRAAGFERPGAEADAGVPAIDVEAYDRIKRHLREQRGLLASVRDWTTRIAPSRAATHEH